MHADATMVKAIIVLVGICGHELLIWQLTIACGYNCRDTQILLWNVLPLLGLNDLTSTIPIKIVCDI